MKNEIVQAIRNAVDIRRAKNKSDELHGFALCTGDDLITLSLVSCTESWVAERSREYPEVGSIYVDWNDYSGTNLLDGVSRTMRNGEMTSAACDQRFETLVQALLECRNQKIFSVETLLCCGSVDPSDHSEMLAMQAVDRLNTKRVADRFARDLGYERYRKPGG